jgi:translation initiation factor 1A
MLMKNDNKSYGEFEEVINENELVQPNEENPEGAPIRVRLPRKDEKIGIIVQRYGGNRMEVRTTDGKSRNCRVPGRYKRDLWLRPKDIVMILPWPDDDTKGDIIYKYNSSSINQLRKKGMLDSIKDEF